jgi:hypothetical protein
MAETGKPKWFHKLGSKPSSKSWNGNQGPVQHIRVFRDFSFSNIKKSKIAEKKPISCSGHLMPFWCFELGLDRYNFEIIDYNSL